MFYTVKATGEAWKKANELFPTDYELDSSASHNAGYNIYWSTAEGVNAWISDLGDRLEINLPNGESINVWIEPEEEDPEAMRAEEKKQDDKEYAQWKEANEIIKNRKFSPLYAPEVGIRIVIPVSGYRFDNEEEKKLYRALHDIEWSRTTMAYEIVTRYCEQHEIPWGSMCNANVTFYHNNKTENEGHAIVEATVFPPKEKDLAFIGKCIESMTSIDRL